MKILYVEDEIAHVVLAHRTLEENLRQQFKLIHAETIADALKLIHDELIALMGAGVRPINLRSQPPVVILLAGLQGAGKTTSAGKLAKWLKENERKKVLLASTDVYRPAAILQLERLAKQLDVAFYPSDPKKPALTLAREALDEARRSLFDVLIVIAFSAAR